MRASRSLVSLPALLTTLAIAGCIADPAVPADPDDDGEYVACSEPAPLLGQFDANAPGYIVVFKDDVNSTEETARLAAEYPIEVISVYQRLISGFYALMPEATVERVRCEATVDHVSYNATETVESAATPAPRDP